MAVNSFLIETNASIGAFAGYNVQFGNVVKVAYASAGLGLATVSGVTYGATFEGKIRVGYSFGELLAYGFFVGTEYILRNLNGLQSHGPGVRFETSLEVIQIRTGWQF